MISVLYVDDEIALLEICKLYLEQTGNFSVNTECSPRQALDTMRDGGYDAIVSDYQMPEMDGIEFLKTVRGLGNSIPFIIFTGRGREEIAIAAFENGADFYLQKGGDPVAQFAELSHKIRKSVEQREAERALKESEERYLSLFERSLDCIYIHDLEGNFIDANPAALALLGYTRDDISHLSFTSLISGEQLLKAKEITRTFIEGGSHPDLVEYRLQKKNGEFVDVETKGSLMLHGEKPYAILGIARDITKHKRAAEALLGREIQLTNAMNLANLVNWEYDIDSRMFTFDDRFYELYGTSAEREGGTLMPADIYFREFVHPDDLPTVLNVVRAVQETIDSHHTVQLEHRIIRRDGEVRDIVVRLTGIVNNEGRIVRHFGANQDITDRKRAEDALRESEEKYRAFFTTSFDCVFITSIDGRWLDFNDSAVHFFGYAGRDELQKVNVRDLYENSRDRKRHLAYIKEKGYSKEYPVNLKKKDGTIINTLITTVPQKDRDGAIIGFQGTIRDITDQKQTQEALFQTNKKLTLLSGITRHDIRNRVLALRSALDLIDTNHLDQETRKLIGIAGKAADTINGQIEFTKGYEHLGIKEPRWQNVSELFRHATLQFLMFDISLDMPTDEYEIFADPLIEKVFYNLLDNALRHGGDVTRVSLSYHKTDDGLRIFMRDNGRGVPDEDKLLIFEQNFGKNTGLGLFLSREILSITGITIEETGTFGNGARFEITVPKGAYRPVVRP